MHLKVKRIKRMKKYKRGFVAGFFDILHEGHIQILEQAKSQCEQLIVAVGTDEFMRIRKGRESVLSYDERVCIVSAIKYVDKVVPVIQVHDLIQSILENLEIIMTHFIGKLSGFQILAP